MKIGDRTIVEMEIEARSFLRSESVVANACTIAAALAQSAPLVVIDERATWVHNGELVMVNAAMLPLLIDQYVGTAVLVNNGTADAPKWVLEARSPVIPHAESVIRQMLTGRSRQEGGLAYFLPKVTVPAAVSEPRVA
jgi:hypothetical protein